MIKEKIEIEEVKEDIMRMFELEDGILTAYGSYIMDSKFYISKRDFERLTVTGALEVYFKDKVINGGYLEVEPLTIVHTVFEIKKGKPN